MVDDDRELQNAKPALVRLAGNVRAWPVAEANAIIAAARGERILFETASAISKPNFSLPAWEARTAQQMWAMEAQAKCDIRVSCYLYGKAPSWQQVRRVRATPECRREHRRPSAR